MARELKYSSPSADFDALQRELGSTPTTSDDKEERDQDRGIAESRNLRPTSDDD
ncbi:DUF3073 family protein [Streptomyces sp. bgisy100]|uniref:DUF3073 family protein n=1 Tax=Streptomyces sp. bgisy100 TaxID=3413783 RepID=UPI003D73CCBB